MEEKLIKVDDIYLNAYLLSDKFVTKKVEVIKEGGRNKVAFYYSDSKETRATIKDYSENDWLKKYISNYLLTKTEITNTLRGDKN